MWGHTQKQKQKKNLSSIEFLKPQLIKQSHGRRQQQVEASLLVIATPLYFFLYTIIFFNKKFIFSWYARAPWKKEKEEEESLLHDRWNIRASLERIVIFKARVARVCGGRAS